MKEGLHLITNFPKNYPWYKKIGSNLTYFFSGIVITGRKNLLSPTDIIKARLILRKGDIVLWGNLKRASAVFIGGPVTHTSLYLGRRRFIEAVADGVRIAPLRHFFTYYDTMAILRLPKIKWRRKIIREAIAYAKEQLGKPYDFEYSKGSAKLFCSELVNSAYCQTGYDTNLKNLGYRKNSSLIRKIIPASKALRPAQFLEEGNFRTVFLSHNLGSRSRIYLK